MCRCGNCCWISHRNKSIATLDLSYLDDELTPRQALEILQGARVTRGTREGVLKTGYPGYDTSVGWFNYSDEQVRENCRRAVANGFTAMKLKVGSRNPERDLRRATIVREAAGSHTRVMVDVDLAPGGAPTFAAAFRAIDPFWIEEPTHPDDILGHKTLAGAIAPTKLALGEHVPNRVIFKNYLQVKCAGFIQVVCGAGERISGREFAVQKIWRARGASCGRHGAASPTFGIIQPRRTWT